jgi:hypothetical protein
MLYNILNKKFDNLCLNKILDYTKGNKQYYKNNFNSVVYDLNNYDSLSSLKCDFCKQINSYDLPKFIRYKGSLNQLCYNCRYKISKIYYKIIFISTILLLVTIWLNKDIVSKKLFKI